MDDLVFDHDGKPYAKPHRTPEQQAEQDAKDAIYWAWVEARMQKRFSGTLAEYREAQAPSDLAERTVKELRVIARERSIRGRSKMRKAALVEAIKAAGLPNEAGPLLKTMMEP